MAISSGRQFYEQAIAGRAEFLKGLVTAKTHETEWLDFKGADHLDDDQIRHHWSRSISGFANNEGGVIVWGIDARFDKTEKIDVASDLALAPKPTTLRDRLRQLHPGASDPPLPGVESTAVFESGDSGPGFVVSYVPESEVKPIRAENMENKPYMLRIGDSFKIPSPSLLRNLFFPRSSAKLHVGVQPEWQGIQRQPGMVPPSDIGMMHRVTLHNAGLVTAKDIFVIIDMDPMVLDIETPYRSSKTETDLGIGIEYERPLHPSSNCQLCVIRHPVGVSTRTSTGPHMLVPRPTTFAASIQVFATDMEPLKLRVQLTEWNIDHKERVWAMPVVESV